MDRSRKSALALTMAATVLLACGDDSMGTSDADAAAADVATNDARDGADALAPPDAEASDVFIPRDATECEGAAAPEVRFEALREVTDIDTLTVEVNVVDALPVQVLLRVDGESLESLDAPPYRFELSELAAGPHELEALVENSCGEEGSVSSRIEVRPATTAWRRFRSADAANVLYDWSRVGYHAGRRAIPAEAPSFNALDYGAVPNDNTDDTDAINAAIDAAGLAGGGVVLLPRGTYDVNRGAGPWDAVRLNASNVVLRGEGSGEDGTIIEQWRVAEDLGRFTQGDYTVMLGQAEPRRGDRYNLRRDGVEGARELALESSDGIRAGDLVQIRMQNPNVDGTRADTLSRELVAPLTPEDNWDNFSRFAAFEMVAEVDAVDAATNVITLWQALPRAIETRFAAHVRQYEPPLTEVGVEDLRIGCDFDGDYRHHESPEDDYGWGGVRLRGVRNGWVRNVVVRNCVQDINVSYSFNVTIEGGGNDGTPGHFGVALKSTWSALVTGLTQRAFRTHNLSVSENSLGNVFRATENVAVDARGEQESGHIDFHGGGFPSHNLFENLLNMRATGAGSIANMPHSGQRNVFWNIVAGPGGREFFREGLYQYSSYAGPFAPEDVHRLFPGSVIVGVYDPSNGPVNVAEEVDDRESEWAYVEGLNDGARYPLSLYEAQQP